MSEVGRKGGVSRQMVHQVMDHPYVQLRIQELVKRRAAADMPEIYENILNSKGSAHHARLFIDCFSPIKPKSIDTGGNIIINMQIFNQSPPEQVEDVEAEKIDE